MPVTIASRRMAKVDVLRRQPVERLTSRQRRQIFIRVLFLSLCLLGLALSHVWLRLQVVRLGYVLSTASRLKDQLEQENRELKVELATLTAPGRLEEMARLRLGLKEPGKDQLVILP